MRNRGANGRTGTGARLLRLALFALFLLAAPRTACAQAVTVLHHFQDGSVANDGAEPFDSLIQGADGYLYGTTYEGGNGPYFGTVFKLSPHGTLTNVELFSETDGANSQAPLLQASDGNFYGTTLDGGAYDGGTVFRITPSGTYTVLYNFGDDSVPNDGSGPTAGLVQGSDGNLYGTTTETTGTNQVGNFFKITTSGEMTFIHGFVSTNGSLVLASDGNFYGAGGAAIYRVTPQGQEQVICTLGAKSNLIQAADGCLYGLASGVTRFGWTFFKCTLTGSLTTLYSSDSSSVLQEGFDPCPGLLLATDGNFYGMTQEGGTAGNGTIFELTPQGVYTQLHSFGDGTVPNEGNPIQYLAGLVQGSNGILYGMTTYNSDAENSYGEPTPGGAGTIFQVNLAEPAFTGPLSVTGTVGVPFTYTTVATHLPTSYSASNLPVGLSIDTTMGLITGTPASAETNTVTITATNSAGSNSVNVTMTIAAAVVPAFTSLPKAFTTVGAAFTDTVTASGNPTSYSETGLDAAGLTLNPSTGIITGTVTTSGTITALLTAQNGVGTSATSTLTIIAGPSATSLAQQYVIIASLFYPGALIQGFDGNFYVTSPANYDLGDYGEIVRVNYQGASTILETSGPTTLGPSAGIVQASNGLFYSVGSGYALTDSVPVYGQGFGVTDPQGNFTLISSFPGDLTSPLIQGTDGNFYGTSSTQGNPGDGFAFRLSPTGDLTVLHNFGDGSVPDDGIAPKGGLILGADGNFYGTTTGGGLYSNGTLFQVTPSGAATILHFFAGGTSDGSAPQAPLVQYSDGSFYGVTPSGGTGTAGVAFQYVPTNGITPAQYTILHNFGDGSVANDGKGPVSALLLGYDGNFYGTTGSGGADGDGVIYQMTPTGSITIIHSFAGATTLDGSNPVGNLVQGSDGNIYGVTQSGGEDEGTLFAILAGLTPTHTPIFAGSAYATGVAGGNLTYTPKSVFGVYSGEGPETDFLTQVTDYVKALFRPALTATNWTLDSGTLPSALSFDTTSGTIYGTISSSVTGTYTVSITPHNSLGAGASQVVTLYISVPPSVTSPSTAGGAVQAGFNYIINGTALPFAFEATGLPSWLTCNPLNGAITGTPPLAGSFIFDATAANQFGSATETVTLTVSNNNPAFPVLASTATVNTTVGSLLSYPITASNSPTSYTAVALPIGLTFNPANGVIYGSPTTAGTYTVPISATNTAGTTAADIIFNITAGPPRLPASLTVQTFVNLPFSFQLPSSGAVDLYDTSGLPPGLNYDSSSGLISGTPTSTGTTSVYLSVSNGYGTSSGTLNLAVVPQSPQTYSQWTQLYPALTDTVTTDTPENDGVCNLQKYVFDINPTTPASVATDAVLPTVGSGTVSGQPVITLNFREYLLATGVTINVQTSPDLQNWTTASTGTIVNVGTDSNTGDPLMQAQVPATTNPEYIRLDFSMP